MSNKHDSFFSGERSYVAGLYTGFKWQCVEFGRRWLALTKGCQFAEVLRASEIWLQSTITNVETGDIVPLRAVPNGGLEAPTPGTLIIYPYEKERTPWGHVGVITHVAPDLSFVGIAEQNLTFSEWKQGESFGRRVPITRTSEGGYFLPETDTLPCLGWMVPECPDRDFSTPLCVLPQFKAIVSTGTCERKAVPATLPDLDLKLPSHALYQQTEVPWDCLYVIDERRGTLSVANANKALRMTYKAVAWVLDEQHPERLRPFQIPPRHHAKLRESWASHQVLDLSVFGRLDLAFSAEGSCKYLNNGLDELGAILQCPLQDSWMLKATGAPTPFSMSQIKGDVGRAFHANLSATGGLRPLFFVDTCDDAVARYNAMHLCELAQRAGVDARWVSLASLRFDANGAIFAHDDTPVTAVYKTCPWASVFADPDPLSAKARLYTSDLPLIMEPLWTAVAGHRALLAAISILNPADPLALQVRVDDAGHVVPAPDAEPFSFRDEKSGCSRGVRAFGQHRHQVLLIRSFPYRCDSARQGRALGHGAENQQHISDSRTNCV
jgi:glutathionylspermidine amidase/synthetase